MEEIKTPNGSLSKPARLLNNAWKLAVSRALQLVDLSKGDETLDSNDVCLRVTSLPEITLDQVSWHDHSDDCWVVLYDRVYDVTEFLHEHPGGADILIEYAGRDATLAYNGFGHSSQAWEILQKYLIGILPEEERTSIFKKEKVIGRNFELEAASS